MQLDTAASLQPVHGSVDAVYDLLTDWLESSDEPLTVRTSGSTGRPKDVMLSTNAVRASAEVTLNRLGGPGQWVVALPVIYVAGLQVVTRSVIAASRPVSLADVEGIADATRMMTGDRRYLACVPTQLFRWLSEPTSTRALTTYDAVIVGGASTDTELLRRAYDAGVAVVTTYGMTETCGGCVYDGLPLDGVAVAIDTEGEIRIAGPMLFDGYLAEPQRTAQVLQGGWFHTGDLGAFDDDGRLVVSGRFGDVVVSGGVNVTVSAVEQRLLEMPGIESACVVGQSDPEWGTRVVAFVVPRRGERPTVKAARDFVAETLPRTWAPRELVLLDAIPILESGKPDREALRTASTGVGG